MVNKKSLQEAVDFLQSVIKGEPESKEKKESKIEVGSEVKWEDDNGDEHEGEVLKIKGDVATVEDDDGDEHKVDLEDLEDLEKASAKQHGKDKEKKESKIEVGSEVKWEDDNGDEHEGEVLKIKGDVATVEDDDGDEHKVDLEDLEIA